MSRFQYYSLEPLVEYFIDQKKKETVGILSRNGTFYNVYRPEYTINIYNEDEGKTAKQAEAQ